MEAVRIARALEIDPVTVLEETDVWRRAVRLAAALEVSDEQKAQQDRMKSKAKR